MTASEVLSELKALGSAQNRKIYARHGAGDNMYGVSFAQLQTLARKLRRNQPLAAELWATGNLDAMSLATLLTDPAQLSAAELNRWVKAIDYYPLADYFVKHVAALSPHAPALAQKWMRARGEYVIRCGYHTLAQLAQTPGVFAPEQLRSVLAEIRQRIHQAPNRAKEGMHNALIAIGSVPELFAEAVAAAQAIGPVAIDHGQTSCKTPDAVAYMHKIHAHRSRTKSR